LLDPKLLSTRHAITLLCAAILSGAGLQALVTWVGLRAINSTLATAASAACREARETPPSGTMAAPAQPLSSPRLPGAADEPRSDRDAQLDVRDRLINAFLAQKPLYLKGCFANRPGPPRRYFIELKVDAAGQETQRTFRTSEGEEPQPELDACVRNLKVPPVAVKPPGRAAASLIETMLP
jgi:hypothetical protein